MSNVYKMQKVENVSENFDMVNGIPALLKSKSNTTFGVDFSLLPLFLYSHKGFVAGRALSDIEKNIYTNEIDLYFRNEQDFNEALDLYSSFALFTLNSNTDGVGNFIIAPNGINVNLNLKNDVFGSPGEILDTVDFTINQCAFVKDDNGEFYVIKSESFVEDINNSALVYSDNFPDSGKSLYDLVKCVSDGFKLDDKLSEHALNLFVNQHPELKNVNLKEMVEYCFKDAQRNNLFDHLNNLDMYYPFDENYFSLFLVRLCSIIVRPRSKKLRVFLARELFDLKVVREIFDNASLKNHVYRLNFNSSYLFSIYNYFKFPVDDKNYAYNDSASLGLLLAVIHDKKHLVDRVGVFKLLDMVTCCGFISDAKGSVRINPMFYHANSLHEGHSMLRECANVRSGLGLFEEINILNRILSLDSSDEWFVKVVRFFANLSDYYGRQFLNYVEWMDLINRGFFDPEFPPELMMEIYFTD